MSTQNAEGLNFKVVTMGREDVDNRPPCNFRPMTMKRLLDYIEGNVTDPLVREEVKKAAAMYPQQALASFKKNLNTHIARARKKLIDTPLNQSIQEPKNESEKDENPSSDEFK